MGLNRPKFKSEDIQKCVEDLIDKIDFRLKQKGDGIFVSSHEVLGAVTEEYVEYEREVETNSHERQRKELLDIAVAAILGMASIDSGEMDW
jgi:hypothetical protein